MPRPHYVTNFQKHLTHCAEGYPLWSPPPIYAGYEPFLEEGWSIGDVVYTEPSDAKSVDFILNVFDEKEHPRQWRASDSFQPASRPYESKILVEQQYFKPNTWLLSELVHQKSATSSEVIHDFSCPQGDGGLIGMPDGARRKDLLSSEYLKAYISDHAREWYGLTFNYASIPNGCLYLITGHDSTSERYLSASFMQRIPSSPENIQLQLCRTQDNSPYYKIRKYGSDQFSNAPTRTTPPRTRAFFIRGYSIAINPVEWANLYEENMVEGDSTPSTPSLNASSRLYSLKAWIKSVQLARDEIWVPPLEQYSPILQSCLPNHLSTVMLQRLIPHIPPGGVALIHDDDWRAIVKNTDKIKIQEMIRGDWNKLADFIMSHYMVILNNGIISLKPRESGVKSWRIFGLILQVFSWFWFFWRPAIVKRD